MTLCAIIPVNRLERAKGRLAAVLSSEERRALSLLTLDAVIGAASGAGIEAMVLTADARVREHVAGRAGVMAEDPALDGLNAQLERSVRGLDDVVVLHADIPLATPAEIEAVLSRSLPRPSITIVPSSDGGTNVMRLGPPGLFPLAYGRQSCSLHRAAAEAAGMVVLTVERPALAMDLDQPADLQALLGLPEGRESPAGRYLLAIGVLERFPA